MSGLNLFLDEAEAATPARSLGLAIAGGGDQANRQKDDFYPTPGDVTRAFLRVEGARIQRIFADVMSDESAFWPYYECWEPCGRGGAITREFAAFGLPMVGTDLIEDLDHGVQHLNVLEAQHALSPVVVTNPPFAIAADIIVHLLERLNVRYLALLLKATFWHAYDKRGDLFAQHPPTRNYALGWRPDFLNLGAPTMEVMWCVWDRDQAGSATEYHLLPRNEPAAMGNLL